MDIHYCSKNRGQTTVYTREKRGLTPIVVYFDSSILLEFSLKHLHSTCKGLLLGKESEIKNIKAMITMRTFNMVLYPARNEYSTID